MVGTLCILFSKQQYCLPFCFINFNILKVSIGPQLIVNIFRKGFPGNPESLSTTLFPMERLHSLHIEPERLKIEQEKVNYMHMSRCK